jgi:HAD superfamily hydrolase (TIGR01509 family)
MTGDGYHEFMFTDPEGNVIEVGKMMKKYGDHEIKAVIFDLDGTLIDSEDNYYKSDRILMKEYGIDLTPEMKHKFVGMGNFKMMELLKNQFGIDESVEYLTDRKNEYYLEIAKKNTFIYPEMKIFIDLLKDNGFPMAIASGSSSGILDELIPLVKLDEYCKIIVSADHVRNGKPAPDIFLKASEKLGVAPENCLVVEDSRFGVEAAIRAFMYCMAIPYLYENPDDNFLMADYFCKNGMDEFNAKDAFEWIKKINSKECL